MGYLTPEAYAAWQATTAKQNADREAWLAQRQAQREGIPTVTAADLANLREQVNRLSRRVAILESRK
jgi:hypothetical protein